MIGLLSVLQQHLLSIGLIWLSGTIIVQVLKFTIPKIKPKLINKSLLRRYVHNFNIIYTTGIMITSIIIIIFFLSNPFERGDREIKTITPVTVDENYIPPTKEQMGLRTS